jgi:hypothetical protein
LVISFVALDELEEDWDKDEEDDSSSSLSDIMFLLFSSNCSSTVSKS